jgi:hypothetical protein
MLEVIRIEVKAVEGRTVSYVDVVTRRSGVVDRGDLRIAEGDVVYVEIDRSRATPVIVRVIDGHGGSSRDQPDPTFEESPVEEATLLVDGKPFPLVLGDDDEPVIGQVRTAEVPFSKYRTGPRDRGRTSKRRPCVVAGVDGDEVTVLPIHDVNSAVQRSGTGRRLSGWKELGLRKSSTVSAEEVWVHRSTLGAPIGMLGPTDMARLGLGDRGGLGRE